MAEEKAVDQFAPLTDSIALIKTGLEKLAEFSKLEELTEAQEDDQATVVYQTYSEALDMETMIRELKKHLRKAYHITEKDVKDHIRESTADS